ncbi:MAG: histidine phosphatase family protein [archaeon]
MKLQIYIFRHGQTYYNQKGIFTGWKDSKLSPKGVKQAKIIARNLKNKKFQAAFYTRLSRSRDTLKEVLKYHPECKKLIKDDRMVERSYGILEGVSHKSFIEKLGKQQYDLRVEGDAIENLSPRLRKSVERFLGEEEYNAVHRGYNLAVPNGESFADVEKRVKSFIRDLKKYMKKNKVNVAISAHGNSIRLFRKIIENASKEETTKWFIPYDKYYKYTIDV